MSAARPEDDPATLRAALERATEQLAILETREALLKTVLEIQRAISNRAPLRQVLDTITDGAASLLGATSVGLGQLDPSQPGAHVEISSFRAEPAADPAWDLDAVVAVALAEDEPVTSASPDLASLAIAAPVYVSGAVDGYLLAVVPADDADPEEQLGLLVGFAQQVGLALADARAAQAVYAARHDPLTGLPNRGLFLERLDGAMLHAHAWQREVTVLFVDLDGFKSVNDSLGHAAGDELLGVVARRMKHCLRPADVVARLGGDEFSVLLDDAEVDADACHALAHRLIAALQQPITVAGHEVFVSASVGVAGTGAAAGTAGELLGNADVAMYEAKRRGRGQAVRFQPYMQQQVAWAR